MVQSFAQSHQGLSYHDRSSISSCESRHRRLFSRILSSFTHNNDSANTISTLAKTLGAGQGQMPRLSGSTARYSSPRPTSLGSVGSTETSLVRTDPSRANSAHKPSSPNPLRAPPFGPLGQQSDGQRACLDQRLPSMSSLPDEAPSPALATASLHSILDITKANLEKTAIVWIAIDVECNLHYTEDPTSSLRSKALGPPHTDPGFLSKLILDVAPASGCSVLRLVGSDTRDFLLPGETWSVVVQILADPPVRRKQPTKAFSLQNRPSSHALMDQLHTMLSPSGPSSQNLVHASVTFEHVLLPSKVQCCVSDKLSLERVSAWCVESRRQYLRHRQSPRKTARAPNQKERQQRDDVACKLLDVLEFNLHNQGNTRHREATEALEAFFEQFEGPSRLHQRASELLRALEAKIRPLSRAPISPTKRRRNAIELSRENLQLQDITNQWTGTSHSRDVTTPAPLFSPRKRPSVANLRNSRSPTKGGCGKGRVSDGGGAGVGSPRFYEDEMDEASRIWRGMRDSSGGSSNSGYCGEQGGGRSGCWDGDENERGRGVLGAPWL